MFSLYELHQIDIVSVIFSIPSENLLHTPKMGDFHISRCMKELESETYTFWKLFLVLNYTHSNWVFLLCKFSRLFTKNNKKTTFYSMNTWFIGSAGPCRPSTPSISWLYCAAWSFAPSISICWSLTVKCFVAIKSA